MYKERRKSAYNRFYVRICRPNTVSDIFTRTRPEVIDGMRAALEHRQKVGEVYAAFTSADTTGGPRS